jgi:hypothetical protein
MKLKNKTVFCTVQKKQALSPDSKSLFTNLDPNSWFTNIFKILGYKYRFYKNEFTGYVLDRFSFLKASVSYWNLTSE